MPSRNSLSLLVAIASLGFAGLSHGLVFPQRQQVSGASHCRAADSVAAVRVASRFHQILSTGDTAGISAVLAPDLRVLEGGGVENRQQYYSHHLAADIEFAKAIKEEKTPFSVTCDGNVIWLVSTSTSTGNFRGREVNSVGAELMILSRTPDGWKIRAVHWSSARRQPPR